MSTDSPKLSTILSNAVCEGLFQRISCNVTEITLALKQFDSQGANIIFWKSSNEYNPSKECNNAIAKLRIDLVFDESYFWRVVNPHRTVLSLCFQMPAIPIRPQHHKL